jgi:hypothetical protein
MIKSVKLLKNKNTQNGDWRDPGLSALLAPH